jgi:hypothetical protein
MKRLLLPLIAFTAVASTLFSACDKIDEVANIKFNMSNADASFDIPPIVATGTADLGTQTISLNLDSMINAQNGALNSDNIKSVQLSSCQLILSDTDINNNFSALEACSIELASDVKPDFITLGSVKDNPDVPAYTLNVPLNSGLELKDYFSSARTFSYKLSATARKTTNRTLHCKVKMTYAITVGPS